MAISNRLYELRRKSGLSQEQLAEQLNVSRQAISKWESGQSVPESEKLLLISDYFKVSLDYLMKEEVPEPEPVPTKQEEAPAPEGRRERWIVGMIFCIGGLIGLLLWGLISIFSPTVSEQVGASSMIQIDGNGFVLILCVLAAVSGAILLLKNLSKK